MQSNALVETTLDDLPVRRGKVRDIYDLGDQLLLVSTDRISAFDWVLPTGIPDKGRVLTQISNFWFDYLKIPNHLLETDVNKIEQLPAGTDLEALAGRSILVRKTEVVPVECIVRGYITGSGWKDYQKTGGICGIALPAGLKECDRLPEPIFTPSSKAEQGEHDENISFAQMVEVCGQQRADELKRLSLDIYSKGCEYAATKGILIADTKFEFGLVDDEIILIDEVLTPDSSRFWPADQYEPGRNQPSYDKQFVRDHLSGTGWDKQSVPPALPEEIVKRTREKYIQAFEQLTGKAFPWK